MLTAIDQIANRNHMQMFKAAIPYLPKERQKMMACFIKFLEFQNVASFFSAQSNQLQSCAADQEPAHLPDMLNDIRNYCDEGEKQMLDQLLNLFTAMELFAVMSENEDSEEKYE